MKSIKKRKDCFWGIHCDYHAQLGMGTVGKTLCEEDIRTICRELHPDYWQIDCKGHYGWVTYPTKLGNAMPDFAFDNLEMWRRVTKEEGVALYLHYSGVQDRKYCAEHPEEATLKADGSLSPIGTRLNGKYVDDLMIPQLSEAAEKYGVDGVWIDGDCWGSEMDYRAESIEVFEKETGISLNGILPVKKGDPYFEEWKEYNRELFRKYARHYVDTLHEKYPDLQITSNWIFSDHMPEPVTVNVDFLSGDNIPFNSLNGARYASRALVQQKMPWDLMGMAQRYNGIGHIDLLPEHPVQIMQQAATAISLGGGFQAGLSFQFDGSPRMPNLLNLKPVADFMREREEYCFKGKPIHQVAMLLSTYDRRLEENRPFERGKYEGKLGLTALLCDSGQSLEIVCEHTLKGICAEYSMIVIPETIENLEPEMVRELLDYAENGGNLLLTGEKTCRIFSKAGAPFEVKNLNEPLPPYRFLGQRNSANEQRFWTMDGKAIGGVLYPVEISPCDGGEVVADMFSSFNSPVCPFAVIVNYGKGKISAIGADIGIAYNQAAQYLHRDLIKTISGKLYTPLARIEKVCGMLEIVCLEKDGRMMLQLINANGNHSDITCDTEDFIPPVIDIKLSVAMDNMPSKVLLQPEGKELKFDYTEGRVYFDVDRVNIHNIIEFVK